MNIKRTITHCFGILLLAAAGFQASASQAESKLPSTFTEGSDIRIDYGDWDYILNSIVLTVGKSDRVPAKRVSLTATRIPHANPNITRSEGNRVFFHEFSPAHNSALVKLRKSIEAVSDEIPLSDLSRNEQLAYWLNLHNVAVMAEIARLYPTKLLRKMVEGKDAVWNKKQMRIGGVPTSIGDIENHIIENWEDPLVLYGFYMGAVGGPNILTNAFTGNNVRQLLLENADEFVNSLRGVRLWSDTAKVSRLYYLGARLFPDFQQDLKQHLARFAAPNLKSRILAAQGISQADFDWYIADLKNGDSYTGTSYYDNPAALGLTSGDMTGNLFTADENARLLNMPPQVRELLISIRKRNMRREGRVGIEEVAAGKTQTSSQPESEQQDSDHQTLE